MPRKKSTPMPVSNQGPYAGGEGFVSNLPIQRLDDDVLNLIFEHCVYLNPPSHKGLGWIGLSHVDRRWRTLILALPPPLWARAVCFSRSRDMLDVLLSRSRDAPLALKMCSGTTCFDEFLTAEEINHILLSRAREIDWVSFYHGIYPTRRTLPLLEELSIASCRNETQYPLIAPSLRHLSIEDVHWTISAPQLRTLRVELTHVGALLSISWLTDFPDLLATHPLLESLIIRSHVKAPDVWRSLYPHIQTAIKALDEGRPVVQMRHLRRMETEADAFFLVYLRRILAVPSTAVVELTAETGLSYAPEAVQSGFDNPFYNVLTLSRSYTRDQIVLSKRDLESQHDGQLTLDVPFHEQHFVFVEALSKFSGSVGQQLRVLRIMYKDTDPGKESSISGGPGSYASIETLEFAGRAAALARILSLYDFPRLQSIVFEDGGNNTSSEVKIFAQGLRARLVKLLCFILRGTRELLDDEIEALRFHEIARDVLDERTARIEPSIPEASGTKKGEGGKEGRGRKRSDPTVVAEVSAENTTST